MVGRATDVEIISPSVVIRFKLKDDESPVVDGELPKRKKFKHGVLTVYSRTVRLQEIMRYVIEDRTKLQSQLMKKTLQRISWATLADKMKTKSADDLRHYWNAKLLPLLIPSVITWTQEDDEKLLQQIVD